jgi:hypothetical protein
MNKKILMLATILSLIILLPLASWTEAEKKNKREFYQLKIYHYNTMQQEQMLDDYLQNALLPALHKNNISKVGVFKAVANDTATDKTVYVLMPFKNLDAVSKTAEKIIADADYQTTGAAFINAHYKTPAYLREESILLKAFSLAPQMQIPFLKAAKKDRVYELRSYESPSEKIFKNKVHMFNEGDEIGLFKRLNFNAVFYSEVIAGNKMPNLMYMTSFENMEDRNAHWKAFGSDTAWVKLKSMPEYQNNVSHIDITFLRGVAYSDF